MSAHGLFMSSLACAPRVLIAAFVATVSTRAPLHGQPPLRGPASAPAIDSTARRCLDVGWLDARASCEGRALNAASLALAGASVGAVTGMLGGAIAPTACLGGAGENALRGAIAGAAVGATVGLVTRHVSRRDRAERSARDRDAARTDPPRPWSWRDVRRAVVALGAVAATGGAIGAIQGSRPAARCSGIGGGAATGAGVYAASGATTIVGSLLVVRLLF